MADNRVRTLCLKYEKSFEGQGPRYFKDVQVLFVWNRDGMICAYCGAEEVKLQVDHILPYRLGGETRVHNAQVLCTKCNSKKGSKNGLSQAHVLYLAKDGPYYKIGYTNRSAKICLESLRRLYPHAEFVAHSPMLNLKTALSLESHMRSTYEAARMWSTLTRAELRTVKEKLNDTA